MTFLSSRWAILVAACAFAAFTVVMLWMRPPAPIDETRYLTVAWEMWRDRSWLVPHLNGELYGHKPPLLFWLIDLVWAFGGVTEFGARLVAPAFGLASLVLTWLLARRLWPGNERHGRTQAPKRGGQERLGNPPQVVGSRPPNSGGGSRCTRPAQSRWSAP